MDLADFRGESMVDAGPAELEVKPLGRVHDTGLGALDSLPLLFGLT